MCLFCYLVHLGQKPTLKRKQIVISIWADMMKSIMKPYTLIDDCIIFANDSTSKFNNIHEMYLT